MLHNNPSLFTVGELDTLLEYTNEDMRKDQTLDGLGFVRQGETVLHTTLRVCADEGSKAVDEQFPEFPFPLLDTKLIRDVRPESINKERNVYLGERRLLRNPVVPCLAPHSQLAIIQLREFHLRCRRIA